MLICVSSKILGTKKNLVYSNSEYRWENSVPPTAWVYGDRSRVKSLDVLLDFLNIEKPVIGCNTHARSLRLLTGENIPEIPWHAVLPQKRFQDSLTSLISVLEEALTCFLSDQYNGNFILQREFLLGLSRASIDGNKLTSYIGSEKNQTVISTLRTFMPHNDGYSGLCTYNQSATVTGRLTVASGPQVLILPKKYRDIMSSRYPCGKVFQVDFVSLEPRVARLSSGNISDDDVYMQLSHELFNSGLTREQCKIAVLCSLYGASKHKLSKMLGPSHDASYVISRIKKFFGVQDILKNIKPQLKQGACFRNYFGRIVQPDRSDDNALVNYYIQSSAVDAATLGFISLKKKINKLSLRCIPTFVIHDAMIVDVHKEDEEKFKELLCGGIDIPTLGEFPVTLSAITHDGE